MIDLPRVNAATTAEWPDLVDELDRWGEMGRVAALWWRDDDAVTATPMLDDLLHLAGDVPVALAVIPALARPELAEAVRRAPGVALLQHGWRHANRAVGGRKSEYPAGRPASLVAAEIAAGWTRLRALFGPLALPVLVPPWNRFAGEFRPLLAGAGIAGLSAMAPPCGLAEPSRGAAPGLAEFDVHVDLVAWRDDRGFIGTDAALGRLVGHLRAQRLGAAEASRPVGILTHHLVMDRATAGFLDRLIALIAGHRAARWTAVGERLA